MRTIVIGDIHGCLRELELLVERLAPRPGVDRLVFLGDFLDKGPDGPGVVRFVRGLGAESVMGNHEEKALRWLRHEARRAADPKYKNPMTVEPKQYEPWQRLSAEDVTWLSSLPTTIPLCNGVVAVHGGFLPGVPVEKQHPNDAMRTRWVDVWTGKSVSLDKSPDGYSPPRDAVPWAEEWDGSCGVIYGHAIYSRRHPRIDRARFRDPVPRSNPLTWCYGIDTGCVHGGRLTAAVFEGAGAPEFVQVDAFEQYAEWVHGPVID